MGSEDEAEPGTRFDLAQVDPDDGMPWGSTATGKPVRRTGR